MKSYQDYGIQIDETKQGEVYTSCPQCSASRKKKNVKCLAVNTKKFVFFCQHCGWGGSLKQGIESQSRPFKPTFRKLDALVSIITPPLLKFFAERHIPESILNRNQITYAEKIYFPQVEDFLPAIAFPFFRNGEVINYKYRGKGKEFRQESNCEKIFYGLDDIKESSVAIICEGEIDKLSIEVAGFMNCISVPDGAPSPKAKNFNGKFEYIDNCSEFLDGKKIYLAVDNDEPGKKLEDELARRFGAERCYKIIWPEGCKDANEVLVKRGKDTLIACIEDANPFPIQGIISVSDIYKDIDHLYQSGMEGGKPTGWSSVDKYYTVRTGEWTVVTGIPSHGKSEFIDNLVYNLALTQSWRFAFFSPENQPLQRHAAKLIQKICDKPFQRGHHDRLTEKELESSKEWLNEYFSFILPVDEDLTLDGILRLAKVQVQRRGIRGLIIDPWNEIDHLRPAGLTETEYISQSLTKIRRFARHNDCHVWVIAHPAKLRKEVDGKYPVPNPYDISGSAHWRNKSDCAITVWRDELDKTKPSQIHIQKIRFREVGEPGVVELLYNNLKGKFEEI